MPEAPLLDESGEITPSRAAGDWPTAQIADCASALASCCMTTARRYARGRHPGLIDRVLGCEEICLRDVDRRDLVRQLGEPASGPTRPGGLTRSYA
jgi:hypothetical protein